MIQQLQHCPLNFSIPRFIIIESLCTYSINLVNEYDCWSFLLSHRKCVPHHLWAVSNIHLDQV